MLSILFSTPTSRKTRLPIPDDGERMTAQDVINHPAYRAGGMTWLSSGIGFVYVRFGTDTNEYSAIVSNQELIDWHASCPEIVITHYHDSKLCKAASQRQRNLNTFNDRLSDEDILSLRSIEQSMRQWRQRPSTED